MKKFLYSSLLIILVSAFISPHVNAQTSLISTGNSLARDTVTNTASKTWSARISGPKTAVTIQVDVTKISGTLAGSLTAVVSNDGTTYYASGSAYTVTDVSSQGTTFSPPLGWRYYGIKWTGTGTMSGSAVSKINAY